MTSMLERPFEEVKRRTRVVGVFSNELSASSLAMEIALRSSELWALQRYLTMDTLEAAENQTHDIQAIDYAFMRPSHHLVQCQHNTL